MCERGPTGSSELLTLIHADDRYGDRFWYGHVSRPLGSPNYIAVLVWSTKLVKCKIGSDEITQVEKYAFTIANDERFRSVKTRWSFWVISNDMDDYAATKTRQKDQPPGRVFISDDGNVEVWVKSWAEVLNACKARMHFVQEQLKANVDKDTALQYLKRTYDKYLVGIAEEHAEDSEVAEVES